MKLISAHTLRVLLVVCPMGVFAACSASSDARHGQGTQNTPIAGAAGTDIGPTAGISGGNVTPTAGVGGSAGTAGSGGSNLPPAALVVDKCDANNTAGLTPAQIQKLMAASGSAGTMRWLYPYDQTVFPRGMLAPLLMWDGGAADAVYLHIRSKSFEYKGCVKPTAAGQLQLAQDVWDAAGAHTGGSTDPYSLDLTVWSQGAAKGAIHETIEIAPATIKGSVYYNSYSSKLGGGGSAGAPTMMPATWGGGGSGSGGMILRIPPKKSAEAFISTGCIGCHSVSANGARLLASASMGAQSFAITTTSAPNPPAQSVSASGCFGGLYPDGSVFVVSAQPMGGDLAHCGSGAMSKLVLTDNGGAVLGGNVPATAMMPTFSPDGRLLVYTDTANLKTLAIATFDRVTNAATAAHSIYTESDANMKPSWPFVLPDDGAVVFERTNSMDYSGMGAGLGGSTSGGPAGDVYLVDLKSGKSNLLARAMGFASAADAAANKTSLPFGMEEVHRNFFPTVSPVAAGGYFWVFFDSVRHYGNLGSQRQLWGAAVRVAADGSYAEDPSRPAFYVSGQEFGTGNHRAFTALDPCVAEGATCSSGVDCCGGFCTFPADSDVATRVGTCGKPAQPRCSQTDEACKTKTDCCNPADSCIAGFCGLVIPQ